MAYKSKDKYLEKNGKKWSYCHVDPASGKPCTAHASHVSAKDFAKTLTAAAHGFEDVETEQNVMSIFDFNDALEGDLTVEEKRNIISDALFGPVDRNQKASASSLIKSAPTDGYFVFHEDASSPLYANLSLDEARAQAEIHSSTRTDGKVYIVSRFDKQGKRDKEFEMQEAASAKELSSKINVDSPEALLGKAIGRLVVGGTPEGVNAPYAIKTLTLALREMKELVVFKPVQFKPEILLAQSVMDGTFFSNSSTAHGDSDELAYCWEHGVEHFVSNGDPSCIWEEPPANF